MMRWELMPAPRGSGSWLVAIGVDQTRAWAPPGVILTDESSATLQCWRSARATGIEHLADALPPEEILTLLDVLSAVPRDFEDWAVDCTIDAKQLLSLYVATGGVGDDEWVAHARAGRDRLTHELALHATMAERPARRHEATIHKTSDDDHLLCASVDRSPYLDVLETVTVPATDAAHVYAAFSDLDFAGLVTDLVSARLNQQLTPNQSSVDGGVDIIAGGPSGTRLLISVKHHQESTAETLVAAAAQSARALRRGGCVADEHWFVTSSWITHRLRRDLARALRSWMPGRHLVLGAQHLQQLAIEHPHVVANRVKFRVAQAKATGEPAMGLDRLAPTLLARMVETRALDDARRRLAANGAIWITGAPGSGKSALALMLVADAVADGARPIELIGPCCGWRLPELHSSEPQVILCDEMVDPGVPANLVTALARHPNVRVVATSPACGEYGLAHLQYQIPSYSRYERARILYNHVWHASHLAPAQRAAFGEPYHYLPIIDDPAFTPGGVAALTSRCDSMPDAGKVFPCEASRGCEVDASIDSVFERLRVLS